MELAEVEILVNELDTRVDRLRSLYEQYFMGIERLEPAVARKDVERRVQSLRKEQIRNTALRFKFQTILQRYNAYQTYWMRICRQIEEGTYRRDLMRANARFGDPRRKGPRLSEPVAEGPKAPSIPAGAPLATAALATGSAAAPAPLPAPSAPGDDLDAGWDVDEAPTAAVARPAGRPAPPPMPARVTAPTKAAPASEDDDDDDRETGRAPKLRHGPPVPPIPAPPAVPAARPPEAPRAPGTRGAPPAAPPPLASSKAVPPPIAARPPPEDAGDARLRAVYTQYMETRKKQNESTASLTYETLASTLRASAAQLRAKHGAQRTVDFEVVVRDGKTILRPIVR